MYLADEFYEALCQRKIEGSLPSILVDDNLGQHKDFYTYIRADTQGHWLIQTQFLSSPEGINLNFSGISRNDVLHALDAAHDVAYESGLPLIVKSCDHYSTPAWTILTHGHFIFDNGIGVANTCERVPKREYTAPEFPLESAELQRRLRSICPRFYIPHVSAGLEYDVEGGHFFANFDFSFMPLWKIVQPTVTGSIIYQPQRNIINCTVNKQVCGLEQMMEKVAMDVSEQSGLSVDSALHQPAARYSVLRDESVPHGLPKAW